MLWPKELIAILSRGMQVKPAEGLTADQVYLAFFDEVARRAVWRAGGNPALLEAALRTPYTPIGSVTAECINRLADRIALGGPQWGEAVDAIHAFMTEHAEEICANFRDEGQPYAAGHWFGDGGPLKG